MKNIDSNGPPKRKTRLTLEERAKIEALLNEHKSIRYIARQLDKSPSTILREINNHVQIIKAQQNNCLNRSKCKKMRLCKDSSCTLQCKYCLNCKKYCPDYVEAYCDKRLEPPYICNGCHKQYICGFEKRIYKAKDANKEYRAVLKEKREGFDLTQEQLEEINNKVSPLIKQGQSIYHIKQSLGDSLSISESTLRRMVSGSVLDARNIDLREQVKRKTRRKPNKLHNEQENISLLKIGHLYSDYLKYVNENEVFAVQMDCVEGKKEDNAVLLTLHFPSFHMQLAFIMEEHTAACVVNTLDKIELSIGKELFQELIPVILTDNGHEFTDIAGMERSVYDGIRTKVFFCEPNRSDEKGSCENNHKLIRYVIPKGHSLDIYNQADITLMMNHINSYSRKSLYGKCPYELAMSVMPEDFFTLLGLEKISPEKVVLNKTLLHH